MRTQIRVRGDPENDVGVLRHGALPETLLRFQILAHRGQGELDIAQGIGDGDRHIRGFDAAIGRVCECFAHEREHGFAIIQHLAQIVKERRVELLAVSQQFSMQCSQFIQTARPSPRQLAKEGDVGRLQLITVQLQAALILRLGILEAARRGVVVLQIARQK